MAIFCILLSILYFFLAEGKSGFRNTFYGKEHVPKKIVDDDAFEAAPAEKIK